MALSRRGYRTELNVWPGWVDGLSSLIIVVIFVLMVFVIAQAFLQQQLAGKDRTLLELNRRVVGAEPDAGQGARQQHGAQGPDRHGHRQSERCDGRTRQDRGDANASAAQVQALSQQIADLTAELQKLNDALGQANAKAQEQTTTIAELTQKLNRRWPRR